MPHHLPLRLNNARFCIQIFVFLAVVLLILASNGQQVQAQLRFPRYVSSELGLDDADGIYLGNNCTNVLKPCATLKHAFDIAQENDGVLLLGGVHVINDTITVEVTVSVFAMDGTRDTIIQQQQSANCGRPCPLFKVAPLAKRRPQNSTAISLQLTGSKSRFLIIEGADTVMYRNALQDLDHVAVKLILFKVQVRDLKNRLVFLKGADWRDGSLVYIDNCTVSDSFVSPASGMRPSGSVNKVDAGSSLITAHNVDRLIVQNVVISDIRTTLSNDTSFLLPYLVYFNGNECIFRYSQVVRSDLSSVLAYAHVENTLYQLVFRQNTYSGNLLEFYTNSRDAAMSYVDFVDNLGLGQLLGPSMPHNVLVLAHGGAGTLQSYECTFRGNVNARTLVVMDRQILKATRWTVDGASNTTNGCFVSRQSYIQITYSHFSNCRTNGRGAAIVSDGDMTTFQVSTTTFANNVALLDGGAMFINVPATDSVYLSQLLFRNNTSLQGSGGALYIYGRRPIEFGEATTSFDLYDSKFNSNQAKYSGGAVWAFRAFINFQNNQQSFMPFIGNTAATGDGGAIYAEKSKVNIYSAFIGRYKVSKFHFEGNSAGGNGGAVALKSTQIIVLTEKPGLEFNVTLNDNRAGGGGGAIAILASMLQTGVADIVDAQLGMFKCFGNSASIGGCLSTTNDYDETNSRAILSALDTSLGQNVASSYGSNLATGPKKIVVQGTSQLSKSPRGAYLMSPSPFTFFLDLSLFDATNSTTFGNSIVAMMTFSDSTPHKDPYAKQIVLGTTAVSRADSLSFQMSPVGELVKVSIVATDPAIQPAELLFEIADCPFGWMLQTRIEVTPVSTVRRQCVDNRFLFGILAIISVLLIIIFVTLLMAIGVAIHQFLAKRRQANLVKKLLGDDRFTRLINEGEGNELQHFTNNISPSLVIRKEDLKIGDIIGQGAQASLFAGTLGGTLVALKLFSKQTMLSDVQASLQDFETEAQMFIQFSHHPNILRFIGICNFGNKIGIVTELMKGSVASLLQRAQVLKESGQTQLLSWVVKKHILLGIASGMAFLHSHDVIHRDIKPENVLLSDIDLNGQYAIEHANDIQVKLCDFGFSKKMQANSNNTMMIGTASYMAPELISGGDPDEDGHNGTAMGAGSSSGSFAQQFPHVSSKGSMNNSEKSTLLLSSGSGAKTTSRDGNRRAMYGKECDVYSFGILAAALFLETTHPYGKNPDQQSNDLSILFAAKGRGLRPQVDDQLILRGIKKQCDAQGLSVTKTNQTIIHADRVLQLMRECWQANPAERPSFAQIVRVLQEG